MCVAQFLWTHSNSHQFVIESGTWTTAKWMTKPPLIIFIIYYFYSNRKCDYHEKAAAAGKGRCFSKISYMFLWGPIFSVFVTNKTCRLLVSSPLLSSSIVKKYFFSSKLLKRRYKAFQNNYSFLSIPFCNWFVEYTCFYNFFVKTS